MTKALLLLALLGLLTQPAARGVIRLNEVK